MDTPKPLLRVRQEPFPDDHPGAPVCPLPSPVLLTLITPSWSTLRLPHKDRVGFKPLHSHCHINSHHDPDKQVGCCVTSTKQNRNPRPGKMGRVCREQGHPTQEGDGGWNPGWPTAQSCALAWGSVPRVPKGTCLPIGIKARGGQIQSAGGGWDLPGHRPADPGPFLF